MPNLVSTSFEANLWQMEYLLDDKGKIPSGGIILNNLKHQQYNYARDLRVVGIWVNDQTTPLTLGEKDFDTESELEILDSEEIKRQSITAPFRFSGYQIVGGMRKKFSTSKPIFPGTTSLLTITQTFLFSAYNTHPAHEPGGVLTATRMFPLVHFEFTEDDRLELRPDDRIIRIRIGYRFHFSLDTFIDLTKNKLDPLLWPRTSISEGHEFDTQLPLSAEDIQYLKSNRPNKAGIFRDNDGVGAVNPFNATRGIFNAAEKPLQLEVNTYGLKNGLSHGEAGKSFWDNHHQWGAYKALKLLPSAPGAFHASHIHWRWGRVVGHPTPAQSLILHEAGKKPFRGNRDGALILPTLPYQSIQFAVTKSAIAVADLPKAYHQNEIHKKIQKEFGDLFFSSGDSTRPASVAEGGELITWFLFDITRSNYDSPFSGDVFYHGAYFAHELEQYINAGLPGLTRDNASPGGAVPNKWRRFASDDVYHA